MENENVDQQENKMNGKSEYTCNICNRFFARKVQFEKHCRQHIKDPDKADESNLDVNSGSLKCLYCRKTFSNARSLKIHTVRLHKFLNCKNCGEKFMKIQLLRKHSCIYHMENDSKKQLLQSEHFLPVPNPSHMIVNPKRQLMPKAKTLNIVNSRYLEKFKCEICDKCFTSQNDLIKHSSTNHDGKPFSCKNCRQQFSWRDQLSSHSCNLPVSKPEVACRVSKTSTDLTSRNIFLYKPFEGETAVCSICEREFKQKGSVVLHYRRAHQMELLTVS